MKVPAPDIISGAGFFDIIIYFQSDKVKDL